MHIIFIKIKFLLLPFPHQLGSLWRSNCYYRSIISFSSILRKIFYSLPFPTPSLSLLHLNTDGSLLWSVADPTLSRDLGQG